MAPRRTRTGQSTVEYLLAVAVLVTAVALGFVAFGEAARGIYRNARTTAQLPYP
ncbi:MAG: hypothetical protein JXB39_13855 [Deltaproteobacteria bacterium]|nr:hypothetical protein [Deltaproteobacteria bacterium]